MTAFYLSPLSFVKALLEVCYLCGFWHALSLTFSNENVLASEECWIAQPRCAPRLMAWLLCRSPHSRQVCKHTSPWSSWTPAGSFPFCTQQLISGNTALGTKPEKVGQTLKWVCNCKLLFSSHLSHDKPVCMKSLHLAASWTRPRSLCVVLLKTCGVAARKGSLTFLHSTMTPSVWCGTHCTGKGESALGRFWLLKSVVQGHKVYELTQCLTWLLEPSYRHLTKSSS